MVTLKTLHLTNAWHATSGGIATFYKELVAAAGMESYKAVASAIRRHAQRLKTHKIAQALLRQVSQMKNEEM